jgi:hypothetical protein
MPRSRSPRGKQSVEQMPMLSNQLRAMIGRAVIDRDFQELLLREPRMAAARFGLESKDRRAAAAIHDASSLVDYAARLESKLAHKPHDGGKQVA